MSEIRFPDFAVISLTYAQMYSIERFLLAHNVKYVWLFNEYGSTNGIRIKRKKCVSLGEIMTRFNEISQ